MNENYLLLYGDKKPEDNLVIPFMFENRLEIGLGWIEKDREIILKQIEENIKTNHITEFIFWGLEVGWDMVMETVKKNYPTIKIKVICNTADALLYYDYERNNFFRLLELNKTGVVSDIGFLRKGLYECYQNLGYSCSYLREMVNLEETKKEEIQELNQKTNEEYTIGIYPLNYTWDKNIFHQLSVGKMIDSSIVHYLLLDNRMKDFLDTMKIKSCAERIETWDVYEFAKLISKNDIIISCNFTDYVHPIALISLELGIPCIIGNNSELFSEELKRYLVVDSEDNPIKIKDKIELCKNKQEEIQKLYKKWKQEYQPVAKKSIEDFINK